MDDRLELLQMFVEIRIDVNEIFQRQTFFLAEHPFVEDQTEGHVDLQRRENDRRWSKLDLYHSRIHQSFAHEFAEEFELLTHFSDQTGLGIATDRSGIETMTIIHVFRDRHILI